MFEEGEIAPKDLEPQKEAKFAKGARRNNMPEGLGEEMVDIATLGFQFGTQCLSWMEPHSLWTPLLGTFRKGKRAMWLMLCNNPCFYPKTWQT